MDVYEIGIWEGSFFVGTKVPHAEAVSRFVCGTFVSNGYKDRRVTVTHKGRTYEHRVRDAKHARDVFGDPDAIERLVESAPCQ